MTTYQDPPPQSRRAVRQSERGDTPDQPQAFPTQPAAPPQAYAAPDPSRELWDTMARRAAQLPTTAPRPDAPAPAPGRRAAQNSAPAPTAEPLTYSTQGAPGMTPPPAPVPPAPTAAAPAAPTFRPRGSSSSAPQAPSVPEPVAQQSAPVTSIPSDPNGFRVRDFSPEGGRRAAQPDPSAPAAFASAPSDLEYRTQARLPAEPPVAYVPTSLSAPPAQQQPVQQQPAPPVQQQPAQQQPATAQPAAQQSPPLIAPSAPGIPTEQTLTRRELRALQEAEQRASGQLPDLEVPPQYDRAPAAGASPLVAQVPEFASTAFPSAPEPSVNTALNNAITEFDRLTQAEPQASASTRGTGHWSVEADHEDEVPETTVNRTVGSGTATTSALVLPEIPGGADIRGPLTRTGEIMLTGSIDLPHTLSSTGATARFDHGGIDALFDAGDAEVISTDSAPVRAIRAVSTHNSGQGVIHTQKPKGTRALTALLISASVMAVVVAGLLIAAFALNVF